eukprot:COSAG02_NODE_34_length_49821_cov_105.420438_2_plen_607_part_00
MRHSGRYGGMDAWERRGKGSCGGRRGPGCPRGVPLAWGEEGRRGRARYRACVGEAAARLSWTSTDPARGVKRPVPVPLGSMERTSTAPQRGMTQRAELRQQLSAPPPIGGAPGSARDWLTSQGFAPDQADHIEAVLSQQQLPQDTWLGMLRGLQQEELQQIAEQGAELRGPPSPEPMMEDDAPPPIMAGGVPPPDDDDDDGDGGDGSQLQQVSSLTRQHSARTEEFLNHRRKEAERGEARMALHRAKLQQFGEGPIVRAECMRFEVGMSDTIGHRRSMEDCMTLWGGYRGNEDEDFFAVFDGHGGQCVAEFAAIHAPRVIEQAIAAGGGCSATSIFSAAFHALNGEIQQSLGEEAMESGSTAVIVIIKGDTLCVANVGDSRAVLERAAGAERLTIDHKPGEEGEKARIEALGGTVVYLRGIARLDGNLAVARSFGDLAFAPRLSVEPFTTEVALQETDRALILACDGLWDVVSDQESIDFVIHVCSRGGSAVLAAEKLRDESLERGSRDNISVMVSILKPIVQHPREVLGFFSTTQDGKLGIIFGEDWPRIKRINEGSLAELQPQIKVGMALLSINGQSMEGWDFERAKPLVKNRPLELVFQRLDC